MVQTTDSGLDSTIEHNTSTIHLDVKFNYFYFNKMDLAEDSVMCEPFSPSGNFRLEFPVVAGCPDILKRGLRKPPRSFRPTSTFRTFSGDSGLSWGNGDSN
jgi:hypothetical protein